MKRHLLAFAALLFSSAAFSQLSHGGMPLDWHNKTPDFEIPFVSTPAIDLEKLAKEDAIVDKYKDQPYRFGVEFPVSYTTENSGIWTENTANGTSTWRLGIYCEGALSISMRFDQYKLPKEAELYVWSADRKEYLGSFNHLNNKDHGKLALGLIHGDKVIIECTVATPAKGKVQLELGEIVHAYRPFLTSQYVEDAISQQRGPFGSSGACNINVNCPIGADWQVEKRAVAIITEGGAGYCSGALVNNTNNDGTPYFLTANHCIQGANTSNWVFYFNHESSACNGSTGPTNQLISGADVVANNAGSDFALLLLNDTPPASYNVQYAGWDATDNESAVQNAVGIHHPAGDVKKICFEDDAPYHSNAAGAQVWWVDNWEDGVTEGGSSGSPLFNQDHRIIGQLYGGLSACQGSVNNGQYDYYGRFGISWDNTNNPATRLIDWLDPGNSGVLVLDGYPEGFTVAQLDARLNSISGVPASFCGSSITPGVLLSNNGQTALTSCVINYQLNNGAVQTYNWSGNLSYQQSTTVNLPAITVNNGNNTLTVWITSPNNNASGDENTNNDETTVTFNAIAGETFNVTISITFDDYPDETSWDITQNGTVLFSGGPYADQPDGSTLELDVCLGTGCYDFTIYDEYGDGICCSYGDGSYEVINQFNQVVADGASFDDSESTEICISATNVANAEEARFAIYPNPADDFVNVQSRTTMEELSLRDLSGRLILALRPQSLQTRMDLRELPQGVYLMTVKTADGSSTRILNLTR